MESACEVAVLESVTALGVEGVGGMTVLVAETGVGMIGMLVLPVAEGTVALGAVVEAVVVFSSASSACAS
jgi:hypothetical protein